jgi:hypothetical protein
VKRFLATITKPLDAFAANAATLMTFINRHSLAMIACGVIIGLSQSILADLLAFADGTTQRRSSFSAEVQILVDELGAADFQLRERAERE